MTRDELNKALLVERFAPLTVTRKHLGRGSTVNELRMVHDDDDLTTYSRRKALDDACDGFDIPKSGKNHRSTGVSDERAGQVLQRTELPTSQGRLSTA